MIFSKSPFCFFQRGFGVLSPSWELKKTEQCFSACCPSYSSRPLLLDLGTGTLDPGFGASQFCASVSLCLQRHGAFPFYIPLSILGEEVGPAGRQKGSDTGAEK